MYNVIFKSNVSHHWSALCTILPFFCWPSEEVILVVFDQIYHVLQFVHHPFVLCNSSTSLSLLLSRSFAFLSTLIHYPLFLSCSLRGRMSKLALSLYYVGLRFFLLTLLLLVPPLERQICNKTKQFFDSTLHNALDKANSISYMAAANSWKEHRTAQESALSFKL